MFLVLFIFLTGCFSTHRYIGKDFVGTNSPCADGTLINMDSAGCELFYFGLNHDQTVLKIRCTLSDEKNLWTQASFYSVKSPMEVIPPTWFGYCQDRYVMMYYELPPVRMEE